MSETTTVFSATGRRKRASARVRLFPGSGEITVNGKKYTEFFPTEQAQRAVEAPLAAADKRDSFDVIAKVGGGGITGQAGAVSLGIARSLQKYDAELRGALKKGGLLRRDPREKERKKAGQPGARKKFQFSKR